MKRLLLPLLFLLFLTQSCVNNAPDDNERPKTLPRALTGSEQELITSGNAFSFEILQRVAASEDEKNVFISPLSISMALGMTLNGAEGETKAGIQQTLGMSEMELQVINESYQSLIELLVDLDPKVKMGIANSIWNHEAFEVNPAFKDTLTRYFGARSEALDFTDSGTVDVINQWVSDQTNGKIDKLIEEIPEDLVLYLINAIYFKGDWLYQFDEENTLTADFFLDDGSTVDVEMMSGEEMPVAVHHSDEVHMAELAYGDSLYQMTIMMPGDASTSIDTFVQESLTASNLTAWTGQLESQELHMKLPKFESDYGKKLNDILIDMGMGDAFTESAADFSNINPNVRLFISEVMHKATITVNEEGSEAAAATSVGAIPTSAPPSFTVDRPFVYLIRERISGTVLFAGVMKDPGNN